MKTIDNNNNETQQQQLRQLAKEIITNEIKDTEIQSIAVEHVCNEKNIFVDKRNEGYYCIQCGTFKQSAMMGLEKDKVVCDKNFGATRTVYITHVHYDGCVGWD